MARVIKPRSIFNRAYEPLDTGEWKTRVLDANRKLSEQYRDPKVVAAAGDIIAGVTNRFLTKNRRRNEAEERLRQSKEGQAALQPVSDQERARIERDRINREAVANAQKILRRRKLESPEEVARAEQLMRQSKAQDFVGRAQATQALAKKRQDDYVKQQMGEGYGTVARARALAASASDAKDPAEALRLRKAAALARSQAYDAPMAVRLSAQPKFESDAVRRDLKELFPPIMREPKDKGKRRGGSGPKGAQNQKPYTDRRDAFERSPVKKQIALAQALGRAGFQNRNQRMASIPAGFSLIEMTPDQISQFNVPPALIISDGKVLARELTGKERSDIRENVITQEAVYANALRDAAQAVYRAEDPEQLRVDIDDVNRYFGYLDKFGAALGGGFRGRRILFGDMGEDALRLEAKFGGLGGVGRPLTATSSSDAGSSADPGDEPTSDAQKSLDERQRVQRLLRQVRSAARARNAPDGGAADVARAQEIIRNNPNITRDELFAQLR